MIKKKWVKRPENEYAAKALARELGISALLSNVLVARGFTTSEDAYRFLKPSLTDLPDPFLFKEMLPAVKRIEKAIKNRELICIYGDYDVDGITSTAILYLFFREIGYDNIMYKLPSRIGDSYGLTKDVIKEIASKGVTLLITVDCGSSNAEEIEYAKNLGIDVIVTDHHQVPDNEPSPLAFINPQRKECPLKGEELAGVGVAFYLIIALRKYLREMGFFKNHGNQPNLKKYLDIVAIGTIADIVPLTGVNRVFTKIGIEVLNNSHRPGIVALKKIANIEKTSISTRTVGFIISPRLNASARLGDTYLPFKLLITEDNDEAIKIARELDRRNRERQELEKLTEKEALKKISSESTNSLVLYNPQWHPGIIGLVAARLTEKLGKPTFILGKKENGVTVGSGRSLPGIHLFKVLKEIDDLFLSYGGHSMAAGLTIEEHRVPELQERFEEVIRKITAGEIQIHQEYDADVDFSMLTLEDVASLELLEPLGEGNPEPLFRSEDVEIVRRYLTSNGEHLKLYLKKDAEYTLQGIAFKWLDEIPPEESRRNIIFTPKINEYNNTKSVELHIRDIF